MKRKNPLDSYYKIKYIKKRQVDPNSLDEILKEQIFCQDEKDSDFIFSQQQKGKK